MLIIPVYGQNRFSLLLSFSRLNWFIKKKIKFLPDLLGATLEPYKSNLNLKDAKFGLQPLRPTIVDLVLISNF